MQFHVIGKFKWRFKHFFFASVCHPRCTSIEMCATKWASRRFYVWKRVDRRKSRFERIGKCNFTWSQGSIDLSNIFFLPLYVIHAAQVYECVPQSQHLGISTFGNASIDEKADLSELENAISRDRKVQVTFQTFFFRLCMSSTLHKYMNVCHKVSISAFLRLETRRSTKKQIWANWRMQFHVIGKFKWRFKHFFFASVCHPRCTSI
jgi:hypothetical protein